MSIDIEADRAIIDAATPGPWRVPAANMFIVVAPNARHNNSQEGLCPPYPWRRIAVIDTDSYPDDDATCYCSADARFISAARSRWPAALDEVERLRAEVAARDATIAELRACLSQLREAAIGAYDDYAPKGARDEYDAACEAADALLAKTAPKEVT